METKEDLDKMTLDELYALRAERRKAAKENQVFFKLSEIARVFGEKVPHNYGPKYSYINKDIEIYVDDYGNYMTVHSHKKGKMLASFGSKEDGFIIPGEWLDDVLELYPEAEEVRKKIKQDEEYMRRESILKELI